MCEPANIELHPSSPGSTSCLKLTLLFHASERVGTNNKLAAERTVNQEAKRLPVILLQIFIRPWEKLNLSRAKRG